MERKHIALLVERVGGVYIVSAQDSDGTLAAAKHWDRDVAMFNAKKRAAIFLDLPINSIDFTINDLSENQE